MVDDAVLWLSDQRLRKTNISGVGVDSWENRAARFLSSSAFVHSSTEVMPRLAMICCVTGRSCEPPACFSMTARSSSTFLTLYCSRAR